MNAHHLELFYFVAKYEGITPAVRKMPYGIQQPAVSGQIKQLEKSLGVTLFQRRPFALTPAGEDLYDFVYPFFSRMDQMTERLRGEESHHLRLAASAAALKHHLPEVLQSLRSEYPDLRLTLRELANPDIEAALQRQEADLAIAILGRKPASGIKTVKLIELPLALAAPETCNVKKFSDISKRAPGGQIIQPLISLPKSEPVAQLFQKGLLAKSLRWEPSMEVSEVGLILDYVARGFGFGIAVDIPGAAWPEGVKKVKLPASFPPLSIGAMHCRDTKKVAERFVHLAAAQAEKMKAQMKSKKK